MDPKRLFFYLGLFLCLASLSEALSFDDIDISPVEPSDLPTNNFYLDDSFTVDVKFKGSSCEYKVQFLMDEEPFPLRSLNNGTKLLKCKVDELETDAWDLTKYPLSPGTHVVRIRLVVYNYQEAMSKSTIIRVLPVKTPTTTLTTTTTTTTRRTTTSSSTTMASTSTTAPVAYETYRDADFGLSLSYPSYWDRLVVSPQKVMFKTPFESGISPPDAFQESLTVEVVVDSLDSVRSRDLEALQDRSGFRLLSSSGYDMAGEDSHQLIYSYEMYPFSLKGSKTYTRRNQYVYVFTYDSEASRYGRYFPEVNRIFDSLQLLVPASTTSTTTTSTTSTTSTTQPSGVRIGFDTLLLPALAVVLFLALLFFFLKRPKRKKAYVEPAFKERSLDEVSREEVLTEVMRKNPTLVSGASDEEKHLERLRALEEEVDATLLKDGADKDLKPAGNAAGRRKEKKTAEGVKKVEARRASIRAAQQKGKEKKT